MAQEARPHGGARAVEDLDEGAGAAVFLVGGEKLEMALRSRVEEQVVVAAPAANAVDVGDGAALVLPQVLQHSAGRPDRQVAVVAVEAAQGAHSELLGQGLVGVPVLELPVLEAADRHSGGAVLDDAHPVLAEGLGEDQFRRAHPLQLVSHCCSGQLVERKVAGRQIDRGEADAGLFVRRLPAGDQGYRVVVAVLVEHRIQEGGAGRHHLHDVPLDDAPGFLWIFDLLADGHLLPHLHESGDIAVGSVVGDSRQRNLAAAVAVVPRRQGQTQQRRRLPGVVVEHLVEIPHAEKQDGIRVPAFETHELLHRWREFGLRCHRVAWETGGVGND